MGQKGWVKHNGLSWRYNYNFTHNFSISSQNFLGNAAYKLLTVAQLINRQGPYTLFSIV